MRNFDRIEIGNQKYANDGEQVAEQVQLLCLHTFTTAPTFS
jgi:hypothetical protein